MKKQYLDQYEKPIPIKDLVILDNPPEEILDSYEPPDFLFEEPWYSSTGFLFINWRIAEKACLPYETSPEDVGLDLAGLAEDRLVFLVDNPLKRWNKKDGFYHA